MEYDPLKHDLVTVSIQPLEEEEFQAGRLDSSFPTLVMRLDPSKKCAVMLAYGHHLAVMPIRQAEDLFVADTKEDAKEESKVEKKKNEEKSKAKGNSVFKQPYWVDLSLLGVDDILDIGFMEGCANPTLMVLYQKQK